MNISNEKNHNPDLDLVSVIMVAYKFNDDVERAILSVLSQNYSNIEIIFVDNSMEGNLTEKIPTDIKNCQQIKFIKVKYSPNPVNARNTGISFSNGNYIAILDSDDEYFPSHISEGIAKLKSTKADLYFCSYKNFYKKFNLTINRIPTKKLTLFKLITLSPIGHSSIIFAKGIKPKYNNYYRRHDFDLWLRMFKQGKLFCWSENINVLRNVNGSSISSNKFYILYWQYKVYRDAIGATPIEAIFYIFVYMVRISPLKIFLVFSIVKFYLQLIKSRLFT